MATWSRSCNYWESSLAMICCLLCPTRKGGQVRTDQRFRTNNIWDYVDCIFCSRSRCQLLLCSSLIVISPFCFSVSPERIKCSYGVDNIEFFCTSGMQHTCRHTEIPFPSFPRHMRVGMWTMLNLAHCKYRLLCLHRSETAHIPCLTFHTD